MRIVQKPYSYLNKEFNVEDWDVVRDEFNKLEEQNVESKEQLENLIYHYNELLDEISNKDIQNYVLLSTNTTSEKLEEKEQKFSKEILIKSKAYFLKIEKKIYENVHLAELSERYDNYKKILRKNIKTYNEDSLLLIEKEKLLCLKYRKVISNITINYEGEEKTLSQAEKMLCDSNEEEREKIWRLIKDAWLQNQKELDDIFDDISSIRNKVAQNSGFLNYGEYMHLVRDRFDYSLEDLRKLHESVEKVVIPVLKNINEKKRKKLNMDKLYPWHESINTYNKTLKPFSSVEDLINKNYEVLEKVNPRFAEKFKIIKESGNLDLEIRKGKTPGGFCFPIDRSGSCFICMNVTGNSIESNILIHESGHGIHALSHADEPIREYRMFDGPGELAEFPAKAMELLALDYYYKYYEDLEDITRAKRERFIDILMSLRRYIMIDALEQWVYTNPKHTAKERTEYFKKLEDRFNIGIEWENLELQKGVGWYKTQLMIIQPLYVISYVLAQLGAVAVYKNYKENKSKTIEQFEHFLSLGFSKPIGGLYGIAGIRVDFSEDYLRDIVEFIVEELKMLE